MSSFIIGLSFCVLSVVEIFTFAIATGLFAVTEELVPVKIRKEK